MKYTKTCVICHKTFKSSWAHKKTCSQECHKERMIKNAGRHRTWNVSSTTVGAISEIEVASDLLKKGYSVFRALSSSCFCDLIAFKNDRLLKVEARTGYKSAQGKVSFPCQVHGNIDIFAIYVPDTDSVHYFDPEKKEFEIK